MSSSDDTVSLNFSVCQVYEQNLEQALNALGLDELGVATSSGWQIDVAILRSWMRKLRGICTHPQVGQLSRPNDKWAKAGAALKSIAEVLEVWTPRQ